MPRDAVSITNITTGTGVNNPAGTTITPANGAVIADPGDTSRVLLRVRNTNASDRVVTVKAGANPPAGRKGLGAVTHTVPATSGDVLLVVESARHKQANGEIQIDFESGMTGSISAVRLPKAA